jgi:hypothetical protein
MELVVGQLRIVVVVVKICCSVLITLPGAYMLSIVVLHPLLHLLAEEFRSSGIWVQTGWTRP